MTCAARSFPASSLSSLTDLDILVLHYEHVAVLVQAWNPLVLIEMTPPFRVELLSAMQNRAAQISL